jgi:hypothetical protein
VEAESVAKRIVGANDAQLIASVDPSARAVSLPGPLATQPTPTVTGKSPLLRFKLPQKNGQPTATRTKMAN